MQECEKSSKAGTDFILKETYVVIRKTYAPHCLRWTNKY